MTKKQELVGLPEFGDAPRTQTPRFGVYSVREGKSQLVSSDVTSQNGLAFSPRRKMPLRRQLERS